MFGLLCLFLNSSVHQFSSFTEIEITPFVFHMDWCGDFDDRMTWVMGNRVVYCSSDNKSLHWHKMLWHQFVKASRLFGKLWLSLCESHHQQQQALSFASKQQWKTSKSLFDTKCLIMRDVTLSWVNKPRSNWTQTWHKHVPHCFMVVVVVVVVMH